jgi:uncharacterized protein
VKLLFWVLIAFVVISWFVRSKKDGKQQDEHSKQAGGASRPSEVEAMLQCAQCGLHIPASEAVVTEQGKVFCSQEHRLQMEKSAS